MPPQPSLRGTLVSPAFARRLPHRLPGLVDDQTLAVARQRLIRWHRRVEATLGPASGLTAIHDVAAVPLVRLLGYTVERTGPATSDLLVSRLHGERLVPMMLAITPWHEAPEARTRSVLREAARLDTRWALAFNGRLLRLLDPERPLGRRYLEIDVSRVAGEPEALRVLWVVLHAATFTRPRGAGRPRIQAIVEMSAAYERQLARHLQHGVRDALVGLATALRRATRIRSTTSAAVVEQSLTLVFRLLFLLFAEARGLVPLWHPVYRHNYLVQSLSQLAARGTPCDGLWEGLQAISRLAHDGCEIDDLRVTAFNGRLFSPDSTPLGEAARVDDDTMRRVLRSLTTGPDEPQGTANVVAYRELGVEELGAVYERLLDASPEVERALDRQLPSVLRAGRRVSARRKESGTFYTPREMADYLVRETLTPLVRGADADRILSLRVLDPAMGSGAFLVAACRFLADAYGQALEREGRLPARVAPGRARAGFRRLVAQRCLFGVDLNPVATGLARLSIWLATLAADATLTFLDHHLRVGNSLLGASVDDLARGWRRARAGHSPFAARGPQPALPLVEGDAIPVLMRDLLPLRASLSEPDETVQIVREKERALSRSQTSGGLARVRALADAWCSWYSWPDDDAAPPRTAWAELADHVLAGRSRLPHGLAEALAGRRATQRPGKPLLPLAARVSRGLLRRRRHDGAPTQGSTRLSATRHGTWCAGTSRTLTSARGRSRMPACS